MTEEYLPALQGGGGGRGLIVQGVYGRHQLEAGNNNLHNTNMTEPSLVSDIVEVVKSRTDHTDTIHGSEYKSSGQDPPINGEQAVVLSGVESHGDCERPFTGLYRIMSAIQNEGNTGFLPGPMETLDWLV